MRNPDSKTIFFSPLAGFLNLGTVDIWGQMISYGEWEGCSVHCKMFISILNLYPLNAT